MAATLIPLPFPHRRRASYLVDRCGLDEADLFDRFRTWAQADPKDVGIQTRAVLGSGRPWDVAARNTSAGQAAPRATAR